MKSVMMVRIRAMALIEPIVVVRRFGGESVFVCEELTCYGAGGDSWRGDCCGRNEWKGEAADAGGSACEGGCIDGPAPIGVVSIKDSNTWRDRLTKDNRHCS